ncbi:MAG: lipid-A-disaccharide synthase, partial [Deltaproteobacteria bacterium]
IKPYLSKADLVVTVIKDQIHQLIRACDAVISVSGTVTLEIALVGTPMVIIYRLSPLTYQIAKLLIKVEHIGLCNIVAGETAAKELIQGEANPENISDEIAKILTDDSYTSSIKEKLATVRSRLGKGGASKNVAGLVVGLMERQ